MAKAIPPRITSKDLEGATHTISSEKAKDKAIHANTDDGVFLYTAKGLQNGYDSEGNPTLSKDSDDVCAKKIVSNGRASYSIKFDGQSFYNPNGMYSTSERGSSKVPGLKKWRLTSVNKNVFDSYLRFLKTRRAVHLEHALREFI